MQAHPGHAEGAGLHGGTESVQPDGVSGAARGARAAANPVPGGDLRGVCAGALRVLGQKGRGLVRRSGSRQLLEGHAAAMQAPGDGSAVGAGGRVGQQSSGTPGCQSGSGSPEGEGGPRHPEARRGPSRGGAATGAAAAGPQGGRAPRALRAGGDAALAAVGPGSRRLVVYPFRGASLGWGSGAVAGYMAAACGGNGGEHRAQSGAAGAGSLAGKGIVNA